MSDTLIRDDCDLAARISIIGSNQDLVLNLYDKEHREAFLRELHDLFDGSYMPGETDAETDEAFVKVEVRRMPAGYVASLPEHEGW